MPDKPYILECDGGARGNPGPAAVGVVLRLPDGEVIKRYRFLGRKTNNQAEYEALIFGLGLARKNGARKLIIFMDSELVVMQVRGTYKVKTPHLKPLWKRARRRLNEFEDHNLQRISRGQNGEADALVNLALDRATGRR